MKNVKEYTLYLGKYVTEEHAERFNAAIQETGVEFDVVKLDSEFTEASKSISTNGVVLYCYFVTNGETELRNRPDAGKIYENGLGLGVSIMHRDLNTYLYQFKDSFNNMEEVIRDTCISLDNSIKWCEEHLNVNY